MPGMEEKTQPGRARLSAAQRRESILRAAAEVFAAAGYRAGKVSDVAALIGVSEPVIFQNFGSKTALFCAVLERAATDIRANLDEAAARYGSAAALLAHVLSPPRPSAVHGRGHGPEDHPAGEHGPDVHGALFADAVTLASDPGVADAGRRAARAITKHLADLVRRGQADGDLRADADPEAAAWLLLSVLSTRPFRAAAAPGADGLEGRVAALTLGALTSA